MSIIETAKRNNLDVYGYLLYLLTVLPEWGKNPTEEQLDSVNMRQGLCFAVFCDFTFGDFK
ncbi:transposase domain-containing protein [Ruminococcus sp.]|uniref:transposase domain-containing protein n=1 Tax=Ruminococcus sp. TaxID=41978 RepID=UPI0025882D0E|nr:transposase domain-containing protein [Ruminococcus sp.]MCR5022122.1 transposase domain-containing protein [Ruminococcus sp.]